MLNSAPPRVRDLSRAVAALALLLAVLALTACPKRTDNVLDGMEPIYVEVDRENELETTYYDSFILLQQGNRAYTEGDYAKAQELYTKLLEVFPDSEFAGLATYNLGLSHEQQEHWEQALHYYNRAGEFWPDEFEPHEIAMRSGSCLENLDRWNEAYDLYLRTSEDPDIKPVVSARLLARAGTVQYYSGDPAGAKATLRDALEQYEDLAQRLSMGVPSDISRAYFVLGEVYYDRFSDIRIEGDAEQLEKNLESKATLLLLARAQYIKAVKTQHPEWMTAGMYKIGLAYVELRDEILEAPLPPELGPQEQIEYRRRLLDAVEPLRKKAVRVLHRNLRIAGQLDIDNDWVKMTLEVYEQISEEPYQ